MAKPNSSTLSAIDIGSVIADTYRIEAMIGRGGMGSVFLASHARLPGKQVAIKVLHAGIDDADVLARFRREAEIASRLGHPNIVGVEDFNITPDGLPYLVLEYLQGMTLADRIAAGPLPLEQTMSIIRQVGSALAAAHREGIVHRDLKPHNIFLVQTEIDGKAIEIAKVLDFGISKIRGSQTVKTQETALLGTPQYMSPEQATGSHDRVDERTDIFAMGAIVHEMLSGAPAFTGASIPEVVFKVVYEPACALPETIPPEISGAVKKAMSKAQPERFPSMSSFVEALTGKPLASPREIVPPLPPAQFAAGSKHTYNNRGEGHASTLASGDHADSLAKQLHATSHDGGAGMASTALGVAVPKPVAASPSGRARGIAADAKTVDTLTPNAQQSLHGVAAEARANKVATDSRGIWGKVLLAAPIAAVAVIALVLFTGNKDKAHRAFQTTGNSAAPSRERVAPSAGSSVADTSVVTTPAPGTKPNESPVALVTEPVTKTVVTPDVKTTPTKPDVVKTDPGKTKTGKVAGKTTKPTDDTKAADNTDEDATPILDAKKALAAGDEMAAMHKAAEVINNHTPQENITGQAHLVKGLVFCKLRHSQSDALAELRILEEYHPRMAKQLRNKCDL